MRRYLVVALAVLTLLGVLSPPAFAQAPAPKVTITGLLDMVTSMGVNLYADGRTGAAALSGANNAWSWATSRDREWYARTRFVPDFTFELGTTKAVMRLEIDTAFGQVSGADNNLVTTTGGGNMTVVPGGLQRGGTTSGFDLNTDTQGSIEVKWVYMEFDAPLVPWATRVRLGAQPFATTYKGSVLASGDFAGVNLVTTWTPTVKTNLTYAQIEEDGVGQRVMPGVSATCGAYTGAAVNAALMSQGSPACGGFGRGDDFAVIFSVEVTPVKGLDVRPIYAFLYADGGTSGAAMPTVAAGPAIALRDLQGRHYVGVDARWKSGPWYLDPTYIFMFGEYGTSPITTYSEYPDHPSPGGKIAAHFADIRGGWRSGPLLLELMWAYASGNKPRDNLNKEIKFYTPISADTGYYAGWAEIMALGIDYFNGAVNGLGAAITLDRFGRQQVGARATYSVTPALDIQGRVTALWTAREINTDTGQLNAVTLCRPGVGNRTAAASASCEGTDSYVGTELDLGLTWRFAPGLTFDLVGAYLFTGGALDEARLRENSSGKTAAARTQVDKLEAEDAMTAVARVRFSF